MKKSGAEINFTDRTCPSCGKPMALLGYTHIEHIGGIAVKDATGLAWQCKKCNLCDLSLDDLAGYERRAAALVLRDSTRVSGEVLRDARKALGLKQADLALVLGCEPETLSRWETGSRPMPRATQLALVALLDGVEMGMTDLAEMLLVARGEHPPDTSRELEVRAYKTAS